MGKIKLGSSLHASRVYSRIECVASLKFSQERRARETVGVYRKVVKDAS